MNIKQFIIISQVSSVTFSNIQFPILDYSHKYDKKICWYPHGILFTKYVSWIRMLLLNETVSLKVCYLCHTCFIECVNERDALIITKIAHAVNYCRFTTLHSITRCSSKITKYYIQNLPLVCANLVCVRIV